MDGLELGRYNRSGVDCRGLVRGTEAVPVRVSNGSVSGGSQ